MQSDWNQLPDLVKMCIRDSLQRVRLIQNAKEEIILSTFAFKSDESGKLILMHCSDSNFQLYCRNLSN